MKGILVGGVSSGCAQMLLLAEWPLLAELGTKQH
jgi:hypothetical protein